MAQYFCVGMSLWDEERMKQRSKQARLPTDEVELPFCEGLEIVSASQLQQAPAVLTEAAALPAEAVPACEGTPQTRAFRQVAHSFTPCLHATGSIVHDAAESALLAQQTSHSLPLAPFSVTLQSLSCYNSIPQDRLGNITDNGAHGRLGLVC